MIGLLSSLARLRAPLIVTVGCILAAGLFPFNFVPANRISAVRGGLRFDEFGQVFSQAPFLLPADSPEDGQGGLSVELIFTPRGAFRDASPIFSIVRQDGRGVVIGQSIRDLYVEGKFLTQGTPHARRLYVDDVCGANTVFVTVTSGKDGSHIYIDGRLARAVPDQLAVEELSGRILIGHGRHNTPAWTGDFHWLAIVNRAFGASEVAQRVEDWTEGGLAFRSVPSSAAAYRFDRTEADTIASTGDTGPKLFVPKVFRATEPSVLAWSGQRYPGMWRDVVLNVAGFVPLGALTVFFLNPRWKMSVWTAGLLAVVTGIVLSAAIEFCQILLPGRNSSAVDLLMNSLGTVAGAAIACAVLEWARYRTSSRFRSAQ